MLDILDACRDSEIRTAIAKSIGSRISSVLLASLIRRGGRGGGTIWFPSYLLSHYRQFSAICYQTSNNLVNNKRCRQQILTESSFNILLHLCPLSTHTDSAFLVRVYHLSLFYRNVSKRPARHLRGCSFRFEGGIVPHRSADERCRALDHFVWPQTRFFEIQFQSLVIALHPACRMRGPDFALRPAFLIESCFSLTSASSSGIDPASRPHRRGFRKMKGRKKRGEEERKEYHR